MDAVFAPLTVRTARYVSADPAPDRGRGRVGEALALVDPDAGLAPGAVLVVRRLRGSVRGRPAAAVDGADLRAVSRRAVRAADGLASADADAVVFDGDAEVLVALARDVASGRPLPWWWATLFGRVPHVGPRDRAAVVAEAFTSRPWALPAAAAAAPLSVLRAADLLGTPVALAVLVAVAEAHGAPALAAAAATSTSSVAAATRPPAERSTPDRPEPDGVPSPNDPVATASAPPWQRWLDVPVSFAAIGALALAGVAAELHRDPTRARTAAYADAVARTLAAPAAPLTRRLPAEQPTANRIGASDSTALRPAEPRPAEDRRELPVARRAPIAPDEDGAVAVATEWAGAVYLLPLLDELDLPAAAIGPGEPGAALTRWGVLALVLLALGADPTDGFLHVAAAIDGRPVSEPAPRASGMAAVAFRAPRPALAWWPPPRDPWRWTTTDGRVVVHGATDLVVADVVPHCADHEGCARAEATAQWAWPDDGPVRLERSPVPLPAEGPLAVEPALRPWARGTAQLLTTTLRRGGLTPAVLRVPGTVAADDLFVRVAMAIEHVDLAVRRLGLDRDPGWVPALGRAVELTFR